MPRWLIVEAEGEPSRVGLDEARYHRTALWLTTQFEDAVGRMFGGAAWLGRRFGARSLVDIKFTVSAGDRLEIKQPRAEHYSGPSEINCRVDIPIGWFAEPGDGLLGIRFLRAALQALETIGRHYDIGLPPIRSAKADPGKPALTDPFAPQTDGPSIFQPAAESAYRLTTGIGPDELVLSAVEPASRVIQRKRLAVAQSLGIVESEHVFAAGEEQQVRAWKIRQTS